jgi:6-phosphogluconolactonase
MAPAVVAAKTSGRMSTEARIIVLPDAQALGRHVADWIMQQVLGAPAPVAIALSGGSTPTLTYRRFAESDFASRFPWPRVHWFWGDERFVPHDHPRSNFRLAWECFLSRVPVPRENIHAVQTANTTPDASAAYYESELRRFYGADWLTADRPLLHINLLGLGPDGHFASLVPGSPALEERTRWTAVAVYQSEPRITLTYPALESSRHAAFLVSGNEKATAVARLGARDPAIPAGRFRPHGDYLIFADGAAAANVAGTSGNSRGTIA